GLGRLVKEKCDVLIKIPMKGNINSLNASNAASIIIYEIMKQRT
ncbi:MAG TPA: 23S rRNA (guanosine(2251)-2'-O)-methyltransferase RlmB, partial [Clostridiales bacterium]|nr:23S rRNA (guanosine(2251)-2'-O)-methyltransferase RlmB [Clostridiales bacterium]